MITWKTFLAMPADEREGYSTSDVRMNFEVRRGLAREWVRLLRLDPASADGKAAFQVAGFGAPLLAAIALGPDYLAEWLEAQEIGAFGLAQQGGEALVLGLLARLRTQTSSELEV